MVILSNLDMDISTKEGSPWKGLIMHRASLFRHGDNVLTSLEEWTALGLQHSVIHLGHWTVRIPRCSGSLMASRSPAIQTSSPRSYSLPLPFSPSCVVSLQRPIDFREMRRSRLRLWLTSCSRRRVAGQMPWWTGLSWDCYVSYLKFEKR